MSRAGGVTVDGLAGVKPRQAARGRRPSSTSTGANAVSVLPGEPDEFCSNRAEDPHPALRAAFPPRGKGDATLPPGEGSREAAG